MPKKQCTTCEGSPDNVDGDYCTECGSPSRDQRELVYGDMRENGELSGLFI